MLHPWNYPCAAAALDLQRGYIDSLQTYSKDFVKSTLKTLFNIVEERFKKIVELWCLCCIMMFRKVNKQPGMQKFWNWCSHYQEIYDWISPLNKRAGSAFILTLTVVYGGKWVLVNLGHSGKLSIFTLLKHLMMLLKYNFFRASFLRLTKDTDTI